MYLKGNKMGADRSGAAQFQLVVTLVLCLCLLPKTFAEPERDVLTLPGNNLLGNTDLFVRPRPLSGSTFYPLPYHSDVHVDGTQSEWEDVHTVSLAGENNERRGTGRSTSGPMDRSLRLERIHATGPG